MSWRRLEFKLVAAAANVTEDAMLQSGKTVRRFMVKRRDGTISRAKVVEAFYASNENRRDGRSAGGRFIPQVQLEDELAILTPRNTEPQSYEIVGSDEVVWEVPESDD